jgi:ABC-2 type transport system ATP-binding protein
VTGSPAAAPPSTTALAVDAVTHRYGARVALDHVSFAVGSGEIVALLGPNGGGKTTLFRVIATLLRPDAGSVRVFGASVATEPARVRQQLGVVFQSPALDARLTVAENLRHHGHLYGLRGAALERRIGDGLERVGLRDRAGDLVQTLSGGLARRAEIAKALLSGPGLLLLDEPTTGLDPIARRDLWRDLARVRATMKTTIVMTTHLLDEAAACDRVVILDRGRVVREGRPADLTAEIGSEVITIETSTPEDLAGEISRRFDVLARAADGTVRIEGDRAYALVPAIVDAYAARIDALHLGRPSLDDVFMRATGHRFE